MNRFIYLLVKKMDKKLNEGFLNERCTYCQFKLPQFILTDTNNQMHNKQIKYCENKYKYVSL